jgi:hypothetical protein
MYMHSSNYDYETRSLSIADWSARAGEGRWWRDGRVVASLVWSEDTGPREGKMEEAG